MTKRKKKKTLPKFSPFELMTLFEECICEAPTLNTALFILIDNDKFRDLNFELVLQISYRLREAKERIMKGM